MISLPQLMGRSCLGRRRMPPGLLITDQDSARRCALVMVVFLTASHSLTTVTSAPTPAATADSIATLKGSSSSLSESNLVDTSVLPSSSPTSSSAPSTVVTPGPPAAAPRAAPPSLPGQSQAADPPSSMGRSIGKMLTGAVSMSANAASSDTPRPAFDDVSPRNVTAAVGQTAILRCRVKNLGERRAVSAAGAGFYIENQATVPVSILVLAGVLPCQQSATAFKKGKRNSIFMNYPEFSNQIAVLIVAIAAVTCFGNSLDGHFVFDDAEAIINNEDLRPETPIWNLLHNDFWGTRLSHNGSHRSYRPVTILSFRLNYLLASGLNPHGFHLTNILLHGVTCSLALPVLDLLYGEGKNQLSFLTALMFAVHPIHTEAVAGVVGRADLLSTFFCFLAFLCYAYSADDVLWMHHNQWRSFVSTSRVFLIFLSMLLVALALFSKEQGITIIGICSAYDILVVCRLRPNHLVAFFLKYRRLDKDVIRWCAVRHVILVTTAVVLLVARWRVMGGRTPSFQQVDNPASFEDDFWTRIASYHYIYALNVWLLLCPEWLCFDWSMGCIPLLRLSDGRLMAVAVFWLGLFALFGACLFNRDTFRQRSVSVALAVLILPFLPASNILFRVGFVLAERILYLPSLGFCMLVVLGVRQVAITYPRSKWVVMMGFAFLLLVLSMRSVQRSAEWRDEGTLFRSGLRVCPRNAKVHYNVAKNAGDMGDRKVAVEEYKVALQLYPDYEQAMNNLANILKDQGQLEEAEILLRRAVELRSDFAAAWMNLGVVLSALQRHTEAEKSYLTAVRHRPHFPDCYYNLGNLYLDQKRYDEAYTAWRNATRQRPTHAIAWNNMIVMLDNIGDLAKAEAVAREAINLVPRDPSLQFNLANTLGKRGRFAEAERHFMIAVDLDPLNAVYHSNMGVLYHRWKKYESAERSYLTALGLNPQLKSAQDNLAMLHRNMAKMGLKP